MRVEGLGQRAARCRVCGLPCEHPTVLRHSRRLVEPEQDEDTATRAWHRAHLTVITFINRLVVWYLSWSVSRWVGEHMCASVGSACPGWTAGSPGLPPLSALCSYGSPIRKRGRSMCPIEKSNVCAPRRATRVGAAWVCGARSPWTLAVCVRHVVGVAAACPIRHDAEASPFYTPATYAVAVLKSAQ